MGRSSQRVLKCSENAFGESELVQCDGEFSWVIFNDVDANNGLSKGGWNGME